MIEKDKMEYRQSTLAYIHDDSNHFLVIQKSIYQDDQWSFAGGGIDEGETPEEAIKRELEEELGSTSFMVEGKSTQDYSYEFPDEVIQRNYDKKGVWQRGQKITGFWVKFTGNKDELSPKDGLGKIKWVSREELKDYLIFPNQWENAERVIEEFVQKSEIITI